MIIAEYDAILGQWEREDFYNHLSNYTKHPYLISSVFNFTEESCSRCEGFRNERDSARRKNQTLEKEIQGLKKKILASEQKLRKALDCLEKSLAEFKAENVEIENMSEENKPLHEESNAERSKCDDLRKEIRRLNLRLSPKMAGRKCFV